MPLGRINSALEKYGWKAEEATPNYFTIYNKNNSGVAYAEMKGNRYVIKDTNNKKLASGNKDIAADIEKVAVEYFYAKPVADTGPSDKTAPKEEAKAINYTWETLPAEAKKINIPKKVDYKPDPNNEALQKLLKPFRPDDDIRPALSAINFDEQNIVATDSHKLVILPNKSDFRGLYDSDGKQINAKYPYYQGVIPYDNPNEGIVTVADLYKYVVAGKRATKSMFVEFPYKEYVSNPGPAISFNATFLIECLKLFLQLGISKIKIQYSMPNRPVLMFPAEDTVWKERLVLLMPVMIREGGPYTRVESEAQYGEPAKAYYGMYNKEYTLPGDKTTKLERNFITAYDLLTDRMIDPDIKTEIKPVETPAPAPVPAPEAKPAPKERKLSYNQQVTLMIGRVKAKGGKMTEADVIAEGRKLHELRTASGAALDKSKNSQKRLSPTPENLIRWAKNPGDFDLIGVDTINYAANPTADYKREINRQKIFNLYGIKV